MKIKHIIWDWNGTLLDDCWLCVESINKSLKKRNLPQIDKEKYLDNITKKENIKISCKPENLSYV